MNDSEFEIILARFYGTDIAARAGIVNVLSRSKDHDLRLLPHLEKLLEDRAGCLLSIPFWFCEIRYLAAQALANERAAGGITEPVSIDGVAHALRPGDIIDLARRHGLKSSKKEGSNAIEKWISLFDELNNIGGLPLYDLYINKLTGIFRLNPHPDPDGWQMLTQEEIDVFILLMSRPTKSWILSLIGDMMPMIDKRLIPCLETLVDDETPYAMDFGEIGETRWLAARTLTIYRKAVAITEPVRLLGVSKPIPAKQLEQMRVETGIDIENGPERDQMLFVALRDRGLLPLYDVEIRVGELPIILATYPAG